MTGLDADMMVCAGAARVPGVFAQGGAPNVTLPPSIFAKDLNGR